MPRPQLCANAAPFGSLDKTQRSSWRPVACLRDYDPQYHLRRTSQGIDAFDVRNLIVLSQELPVRMIDPARLAELDLDHWYFQSSSAATPRSPLEDMRLILAADIRYPIILDKQGRVMDGMHRVCRAVLDGIREIPAVQFAEDPEPDFVNCNPDLLPYEDK